MAANIKRRSFEVAKVNMRPIGYAFSLLLNGKNHLEGRFGEQPISHPRGKMAIHKLNNYNFMLQLITEKEDYFQKIYTKHFFMNYD